ncbi:MAG: UPF0149 family protein [Burkholderiaceae bacterium]
MQYPQFDRASNNAPLNDTELQAFDDLLQGLPVDGAMTLEGVDGYLTALLLGPAEWLDARPTADWLPALWGGDGDDGAPFESNRQRKRATLFALRHLQAVACVLRDHPRQWEPLFSIVESEGPSREEWVDAQDWCIGFLQAMDLAPEAWAAWRADPVLGPPLAAIALLGGDEVPAEGSEDAQALADPAERDAMARQVAEGVLAMHARRYPGASPA